MGKVIDLENEKNNLLVIELLKRSKEESLVPFVKQIVPLIDIKNNYIMINPPKGAFRSIIFFTNKNF